MGRRVKTPTANVRGADGSNCLATCNAQLERVYLPLGNLQTHRMEHLKQPRRHVCKSHIPRIKTYFFLRGLAFFRLPREHSRTTGLKHCFNHRLILLHATSQVNRLRGVDQHVCVGYHQAHAIGQRHRQGQIESTPVVLACLRQWNQKSCLHLIDTRPVNGYCVPAILCTHGHMSSGFRRRNQNSRFVQQRKARRCIGPNPQLVLYLHIIGARRQTAFDTLDHRTLGQPSAARPCGRTAAGNA